MIRIASACASVACVYLLGAFVAADFNIASWGTDGRFFAAGLMATAFIMTLTFPGWGE